VAEAGWRIVHGLAHKGMLESARNMFAQHFDRVCNVMAVHGLRRLYIAGHSLGSARCRALPCGTNLTAAVLFAMLTGPGLRRC